MSATKVGYAQIFSSHEAGVAHNVHIPESQKAAWESIKNSHVGNYYETSLLRAVLRLAVGDKTVAPQANIGEFNFSYTTSPDRKDIFINVISIKSDVHISAKTPGIYKPEWDGREWTLPDGAGPVKSMDLDHAWSNNAHVATIPGKFDNKEDASSMMGVHIEKAYQKGSNALSEARQQGNYFSLFWLNNEFTSKEHIQSLVSMIQQAQKQSKNMKWLIHGEGCGTFVQALRFIKANPVASDIITAQKGMANQDVFFSNPRGRHTSKKDLEAICKSVGMVFIDININKNDVLYNADARKDALKPVKSAAGKLLFTGGGASTFLASEYGPESVQRLWSMITSSPELTVGTAVAVAGGVVVVAGHAANISSMARNLKGAMSSTFGSGNQNWAS
ncbi:hypothetical protein [Thalassolituus sp.]|uniref:hypothetical protein n=1 Tax=Thalassolituus sp. TaxID=2030822 RepID=UPI003518D7E9